MFLNFGLKGSGVSRISSSQSTREYLTALKRVQSLVNNFTRLQIHYDSDWTLRNVQLAIVALAQNYKGLSLDSYGVNTSAEVPPVTT